MLVRSAIFYLSYDVEVVETRMSDQCTNTDETSQFGTRRATPYRATSYSSFRVRNSLNRSFIMCPVVLTGHVQTYDVSSVGL
jgi:hypothetical protein